MFGTDPALLAKRRLAFAAEQKERKQAQQFLEKSKNLLAALITGSEEKWRVISKTFHPDELNQLRILAEEFSTALYAELSQEGKAVVEEALGGEPPTKTYTIEGANTDSLVGIPGQAREFQTDAQEKAHMELEVKLEAQALGL